MIEFDLPDGIAELEAELARFAARDLAPRMRDFEAAGAWDPAAVKSFDGFGVPALELPEAWGGAGAGCLAKVVALEATATGDAGGLPAADQPGAAASAFLACPDARLAARIASAALGREGRCVLQAGSAGRLPWVPGPAAPQWVWVSDGPRLALLETGACRAEPAAAAAFEASGGVGLDLAGARPAGEWQIGEEAGRAVRGRARLWVAAVALGVGRASLAYAIAYATERVVMGRPVAHHQANAFSIAGAATDLEAARATVRAAAHRFDTLAHEPDPDHEPARAPAGRVDPGLWATLAFLDALDAARAATDLGVQLLGGHGYVEDHPAEKWFREARALAGFLGGRDAALEDASEPLLSAADPEIP